MKQYKISKEDILQATNGGLDIIRYYVPDIDESVRNKNKKFALRNEKTPSCAIKSLSDGNYVVADFGDDGKWMNGILLTQKLENVEFGEAIKILAERHGIGTLEGVKSMYEAQVSSTDALPDQKDGEWIFKHSEFVSESHLSILFSDKVWTYIEAQYKDRTTEERKEAVLTHLRSILTEQHWHSLESYTIIKERKAITFTASEFYPIFRIEEVRSDNKRFSKIYQPKSKDKGKRFFYYGDFDAQFLHGYQQFVRAAEEHEDKLLDQEAAAEDDKKKEVKDYRLEEVVYCTGGSDALNFRALGYHVVYPSSEHFKLTKDHIFKFESRAKSVLTCPDLDVTGQRQNHRLCLDKSSDIFLNIRTIELPESLKNHRDQYGRPCKDLRDYLKYYRAADLKNLVKVALMYRFWDMHIAYDRSGKVKMKFGKPQYEYKLSMERVLNFLTKNGFGRRKVNDEVIEFIQIDGNIVRQVKPEDIKGFLLNFLRSRYMHEDLLNVLHRSPLLSSNSFESLPLLDPDFSDCDSSSQYLFFQNITWKITAKEIEEIRNDRVERMVLEKRILQHKVKKLEPMFTATKGQDGKYSMVIHNQESPFFRFLIQTSRVHWRKELEDGLDHLSIEEQDAYKEKHKFDLFGPNLTSEEHYDQMLHCLNKMYVFGYMAHRYKIASRSWIAFGMDDTPNRDSGSFGGTGKSLLFKGLQVIKNILELDGKDKDLFNDKHVFENVSKTTDIIYIDDADRNFPMERLYSMTTNSLTINPKGKTRTSLSVADSPKIGVTTNFSPDNLSASTVRRLLFFATSNYYHVDKSGAFRENRQPKDDFGKDLWSVDYTPKEWELDFNFMAQCCQLYLAMDEWIEAPMDNIMDRSLTNNMGLNFLEWAEVFFDENSGRLNSFVPTKYALGDYAITQNIKNITTNGFNSKLKMYAQLKGLTLNPKPVLDKNGRVLKNIYEHKFNPRDKKWERIGDKPITQAMIYLQSNHTEITKDIYDPTQAVIDDFPAPVPGTDAPGF